ncbi:FdhF/YdeP family oxidoreductase [Microscilla marina]|uniref:Oxidoreductase alpha (Molybdopterin) subunit n=1 Tax=Microscilla marina ATCC 23134 TaxID=313606 RepID=A1ZG89_MICM2|nr:FdhF/YdeP family oxidoreductase [Microscilla marina]EAY30506.1 oxidoreductase alpha (molybdopterin) subunit [Microscilla marina ATCC 23134]
MNNIDSNRQVNPLTSEEFTGLKIKPPKEVAAGAEAVKSALHHIAKESGIFRGNRILLNLNQKKGFDCPGCAWPDPKVRSAVAEYCENGAKAVAEETTLERVDPAFFKKYSVGELSQKSDYWLGKSGRITHPMVLKTNSQHYEPIAWEEAFAMIAQELNDLSSPDEAVFYTSGRTSNEAAFMYQLFVRQFGTNNLPDCSNMCHESSGAALSETLGIGKGSVTLEDFNHSQVILVIGQNPGTNHPRMLSALQEAKQKGAKIIHVNPLPETGLQAFKNPQKISGWIGKADALSDIFLQVRINGDMALLKGLLKLMANQEAVNKGSVFDREFIDQYTEGFEEFWADIQSVDLEQCIRESGIDPTQLEEAAQLLCNNDRIIVCWAMGLTQHPNSVAMIKQVVNLLLAKGSIGKQGAGTCPVRGHSNVQGDRTMGIWEKPPQDLLDQLEKHFGFKPPSAHGYDTVDAIKAMYEGKGKVFFAMGGNFLSATPDTVYTAQALQNCHLTVQVSTKLNRSHLVTGKQALILPCMGRTELDVQQSGKQFVTVENSMGVVHQSRGRIKPASPHLLSEPAIIARLAQATFEQSKVDWQAMMHDYDVVRDHIEATIEGFEQYNERVRQLNGFNLPNVARERKFIQGKAYFTVHPIPKNTLANDEFIMMTIRSHDQFNTTIYGLDDRYRGIYNERRVVLMNQEDMKEMGLVSKQQVNLKGNYEGEQRVAPAFLVVPFDIPKRCIATYFPEANVLVPINSVAKKSNTPTSKYVVVSIEKSI